MILHSPIISGSLTFADNATFNLPDGGEFSGSFSGSLQIEKVKSDLIPDTSGAYDLGSEAYPYKDLWLVGSTLNLGGIGISVGSSNDGLSFKKKSDNTPAAIGAKSISIGGIGVTGNKKFGLDAQNKVQVLDDNDDVDTIIVKDIVLKDTSGNGKNTKLKVTGGKFTSEEVNDSGTTTSADAEGSLSGSFTGSIQDADFNGDATFNNGVSVTGTSALGVTNVSGLASLDGGVDVDGAFTVADSTGNVSTSGTLGVTGTSTLGVINASGLLSADAGIDVDGAFTVADSTGNVVTSGTLSAGNTTVGTLGSSGLASLDGGIDVDGVFTVADGTGNVSTSGTLSAGNTDVATLDASGLASLDGGVDVDGAFTVANTSGNVSTSGTLNVSGLTTVGVVSGSNGDFTGNLAVGGNLTVAGAMTNDGHIIPAEHNTYDLGSATKFWRDLYLSSGSLYINGIQVLSTDGTDLTFQTDEGESTKILETANDTITLESVNGDITFTATGTGNIELDAPVQIAAGKNILSSDGNAIAFASDISLGSNDIFAANLSGVVSSSAITYDGDNISVAGNAIVVGNLTVQGTTTSVDSNTVNIGDNQIVLNSDETGTPSQNGGIAIERGTSTNASLIWNETNDYWMSGLLGAESRIVVGAGNTDITTLGTIATGTWQGTAITHDYIGLDAIDGTNIANDAIDSEHYTDGSIDTDHIAADAVTGAKIAADAIDSEHYADASIDRAHLSDDIINSNKIADNQVLNEHIGNSAIGTDEIAGDAVTGAKIPDNAIGNEHIADDAVDSAQIADDAINSEHYTDGSIDTVHIGDLQVTNGKIAADAIDGAKIADEAIDSEHYVDGSIDAAHLASNSVSTIKIADDAVTSAKLAGSYTGTWAVTGAITATGDITAYASSDERLKDNIQNIENPIEKVQSLKGVTWDWNDNASDVQHSLPNVGVIAQDVEKVLPQLVRDNEGGYKAVDYDKLVGLLIEAVKDQQSQIDELKSKLG